VSHVRHELGFYIPDDGILHSRRRKNLNSYISSKLFLNVLTIYGFYGVTSEKTARSVRRLLVNAFVPSSPILVILMKEALSSSETSVLIRATR
jgi:hypothetical protein